MPHVDLGGPRGGEQEVVESPVRRQRRQPAFADDDDQRGLLAGRLDQPAKRAGPDEVPPGVQQDDVGGGGVQQGRGLSRGDFDLVGKQLQRGQDLRGGVHIVGQQEQGRHSGLLAHASGSADDCHRNPAPSSDGWRTTVQRCRAVAHSLGRGQGMSGGTSNETVGLRVVAGAKAAAGVAPSRVPRRHRGMFLHRARGYERDRTSNVGGDVVGAVRRSRAARPATGPPLRRARPPGVPQITAVRRWMNRPSRGWTRLNHRDRLGGPPRAEPYGVTRDRDGSVGSAHPLPGCGPRPDALVVVSVFANVVASPCNLRVGSGSMSAVRPIATAERDAPMPDIHVPDIHARPGPGQQDPSPPPTGESSR